MYFRSSSNLDSEDSDHPSPSSAICVTPTKKKKEGDELSSADKASLTAMKDLSPANTSTATEHFCMRIADSLEKLPKRVV